MKSKAQIANHPLHPMLIVVPAGAFITALVLDIIYLISGVEMWWDAALPVIIIGVVGGLIAAVPGTIDLFSLGRHKKEIMRTGLTHMVMNLIIVGLFIINAIVRWDQGAPAVESLGQWPLAFWLSLLGVGLLAVSGWLGWKMVYEHHMGVVEDRPERERGRERRVHGGGDEPEPVGT